MTNWCCILIVQAPGRIAPANGSTDRYLVQQALNYTASEVHTSIGGLFNPEHTDETRAIYHKLAAKRLTYLDTHVVNGGKRFLVGNSLIIADLYLYIVLTWTAYVGIDLTPYNNVKTYFEGIRNLPQVQAGHALIATNPTHTI